MNSFGLYLWEMLKTSGPWLIISFTACGLIHGVLRPESLQRSLGNKKFSSIVKVTISGMFLPVCSCGVLPLSIGLYRSGAYLGPTLAFLVAAPIINPAAIILSYALLGPQISTIYLASGFLLPVIIGLTANRFGGKLTVSPHSPPLGITLTCEVQEPLLHRLAGGLKWGFEDLAVQTCRFIIVGTGVAALLLAVIPATFIQNYLSNPQFLTLIGATLLGALMYVCAIAHIPFIAALVGIGTAPGIALAFLLSGVSTNLPKMISVWKLIGKRAVLIFAGIVVVYGIAVGFMMNLIFADSFLPQFERSETGVALAGYLNLQFPDAVKTACAVVVAVIAAYAWVTYVVRLLRRRRIV